MGASHPAAAAERAVAQEAVVLAHEEVRFHDAQRVERHAHDDEQGRAAEEARDRPRDVEGAAEDLRSPVTILNSSTMASGRKNDATTAPTNMMPVIVLTIKFFINL